MWLIANFKFRCYASEIVLNAKLKTLFDLKIMETAVSVVQAPHWRKWYALQSAGTMTTEVIESILVHTGHEQQI